ncbi:hypothetical protein QR680_018017 [Steinernema hermaphroditum]|uniref:Uncharacterized protein n=1 Tax=Steinernema hermaphroditum TaxID=289476 RepID=A0AA39LQF5_9BILA|nr:hypothetical protein QR680_018017 [Steinernema hermaphroditum]
MAVLNIIIGSFYCILSASLFVLNSLVLLAILRHKEFKTNTYHIIKIMVLGCLMQLCSHFVGGVMTITVTTPYHVEKIFGAWVQCGWYLYQGASLALAVDRALIFVTKSSTKLTSIVCWGLMVSFMVIGLVYLVIFLLPGFGFNYSSYFDWFYNRDSGSMTMLSIEKVLDFSLLTLDLFLYFVVFACLIRMRRTGGSDISGFTVEIRILLIAVLSFLYECTYLLWFFWGSKLISNPTVSSVIVTVLWIVDCGVFSFSTLLINSSVRKKLYQPITRSENKVTASRQGAPRVNVWTSH